MQLVEWVLCVVLARVMCGTLVVLLGGLLVHVAQVRAGHAVPPWLEPMLAPYRVVPAHWPGGLMGGKTCGPCFWVAP